MSNPSNAPELISANRQQGHRAEIPIQLGGVKSTVMIDLVDLLARAFELNEHSVTKHESWVTHLDSGLVLSPQICDVGLIKEGVVRTSSTIQINHSTLIPDGVFEFQHSSAENLEASFLQGFQQWLQLDFPVLIDALGIELKTCTGWSLEIPKINRFRRILFGPVANFAANRAEQQSLTPEQEASGEHAFCSCCLLTKSFEHFKELVDSDKFCALRLYAARLGDGNFLSDCRLNGEDYPEGAEGLKAYAQSWPGTSYDTRKQYVVIQNIEGPLP